MKQFVSVIIFAFELALATKLPHSHGKRLPNRPGVDRDESPGATGGPWTH